jgi:hypothetical protein
MIKKLLKLSEQDLQRELKEPNVLRIYPAEEPKDSYGIAILWAPFDYVNRNARLAIVGVTPGPTQAMLSYKAVLSANAKGEDPDVSLARTKAASSFRGKVIETNLKSLLEHSGVSERVGIDDIDQLWSNEAYKLHFTSTIRYPTFLWENDNKKKLYNNQIDSLTHPELKRYVETCLAEELSALPTSSLIVALGSKGPRIVRHAAKIAGIDHKRVVALPHPSGSAAGAVRDFLTERRTESSRPCRCMLCDRSRIPAGWDLSGRFARHDQTHRSTS